MCSGVSLDTMGSCQAGRLLGLSVCVFSCTHELFFGFDLESADLQFETNACKQQPCPNEVISLIPLRSLTWTL